MTKKYFVYEVSGMEKESAEAFGEAFRWAKNMSAKTGDEIWRTCYVNEETNRIEFYAKGGCFLNIKFYSPEKAEHF